MSLNSQQFGDIEDHGEFRIDFAGRTLEVGGQRLPVAHVRRQSWSRQEGTPAVWNADVPMENGHLANLELVGRHPTGPQGEARIHMAVYGDERSDGGREVVAHNPGHWYHDISANALDLTGAKTVETLRHWVDAVPPASENVRRHNQSTIQERLKQDWDR